MSALTPADIILRPVISEKSIDVSTLGDRRANAGNKYTFAVHRDANKIQIKAAIEELYAKEKRRGTRRGRISGYTTPWRKAIVTLAPGQKIEFFEGV